MSALTPETIALVTAIGGFVVPPLTQLAQRERWSAQVKQIVAMALSLGVAAVAVKIADPHAFGRGFVALAGEVFGASQLSYAMFRRSAFMAKVTSVRQKVASKLLRLQSS